MEPVLLKWRKLHPYAEISTFAKPGDAGMDIKACMCDDGYAGNKLIDMGRTTVIPTGLAVEIPPGYELQVRTRSGMAIKGIFVMNAPGTIDSGYRGEIKIILARIDAPECLWVTHGDRIAQLVLNQVPQAKNIEVEELSETSRGEGGFGSTGK